LKKYVPMLATMLLIATLASVAVPFFNGFAGEFPILVGSWISKTSGQWPTLLAATGMVLSAVYMLWWFQRLMLGPVTKEQNKHLPDLTRTEWAVLLPLAVIIFWFGLGSPFWTERMNNSVESLLHRGEEVNDDLPVAGVLKQYEQSQNWDLAPQDNGKLRRQMQLMPLEGVPRHGSGPPVPEGSR
jgi:NADH-quinone oxidoreductase subunit M